jgi:hypothetical protein
MRLLTRAGSASAATSLTIAVATLVDVIAGIAISYCFFEVLFGVCGYNPGKV